MTVADDTQAARFRRIAGAFHDVAAAVPADRWTSPAPCEGWVARDVVRHLVEWVPAVIGRSGVPLAGGPDVDADPVGAFDHLAGGLQAALDDPALAAHRFDVGPPGEMTVEAAIGMIVTGDVLIHTWDLARATGQAVRLDPTMVHDMLVGMEPMDEMLRSSGHYGARVHLDADADEQDRLIAFTGRDPR